MGRNRSSNKHLPRRLHLKYGGYYYVYRKDGKYVWLSLGRNYGTALLRWAELEGKKPESERTISHAIGNYLESEKHRLKPMTLTGYQRSAARLIAVFGKMELVDLTPHDVYRFLREHGNVQANRDKALLSAVYTAARSWGWFSGDNPAKGVRRNQERPRKRYVSDSELDRLLAKASPQMACMIRFGYLTGMREGDILRVRLSDLRDDGIFITQGKTGKEQWFDWTDELKEVVDLAKSRKGRVGSIFLFCGRKGKPYTGDGFRAMWRRVKINAGLPDVQFHDMRRKAGSDVTDAHAQLLLGHDDPRTTRRHYRAKPERVKPVR